MELKIDSKKDKYGYFVYENIEYGEAADYYMSGVFGFCGCGMPEATLEYIHDGLQLIADLQDMVWEEKQTYEEWRANIDRLFGGYGQEYFFFYVMDTKDLIEHGGSVPGWLTDDGRDALHDLKLIISAFED